METAMHVGAYKKLVLVIGNPVTMLFLSLTICGNVLVLSRHDFWTYISESWFLNLLMGVVVLMNLNTSLIAYRRTWRALERRHARGKVKKTKFRAWLWIKALKMPCSIVGALIAVQDFKKYRRESDERKNAEAGAG
jgi:hypothetical protein